MAVKTVPLVNNGKSHLYVNDKEWWGFQDGDTISWEDGADTVQIGTDAQGTVIMNKSNDETANVTINLTEASPCNALAQAHLDKTEIISLKYVTPNYTVSATQGMFTKFASGSSGKNATARPWAYRAFDLKTAYK